MTVETYLKQGIFLDRRIKYQLQRIAELRGGNRRRSAGAGGGGGAMNTFAFH